jgi:energy-coupling factor transporter ATP-binding protein EcfA2
MNTVVRNIKLIKSGPPNDTVFVLGPTGCGKTTLIANLAMERERFVIVDTKDDFPPEAFSDAVPAKNLGEFTGFLNAGHKRIVYQLWHDQDPEFALGEVCKKLQQFHTLNSKRNLDTTFILDETNNFVYVNHCNDSLRDLILRGRSVGIRKILGAQWFSTVPPWMRDSFTEIYTFRHTDENGVERLAGFGFEPEEVQSLPPYVCLYSGKNKLEKISLVPVKSSK